MSFFLDWLMWWKRKSVKKTADKEAQGEQYWTSKYPQTSQLYRGRPIPGTKTMFDLDVRHFIWEEDIVLRDLIRSASLQKLTIDDTALAVQQWVVKNLQYVSDETIGASEYWLFPGESMARKKGDCEDGATLMASILINAVPVEQRWRVRVTAGMVKPGPTAPQGGHGYCVYIRDLDNEAVVLDWCFLEDSTVPVKDKPIVRDNTPYREVWFSFNHQYAWSHTSFNLGGRLKKVPAI